ncbi:MAG: ComEC/Rec2 family competence protein [Parachlamydiaceae bacterium]|nr:ComEC/Rec2 family competence protein [Parachlamydiaceae bacterium]
MIFNSLLSNMLILCNYPITHLSSILIRFWSFHPALFYGISLLLGIYIHFFSFPSLLISFFFLLCPFIISVTQSNLFIKPLILSSLVVFCGWFYTQSHYVLPIIPSEGVNGNAVIHILQLQNKKSMFGERWVYSCEIHHWKSYDSSFSFSKKTPCLIFLSKDQEKKFGRPKANQDYIITGKLIPLEKGGYQLKLLSNSSWIPVNETSNFAENRYQWKTVVSKWIKKKFPHQKSGVFLAGLVTGEFDDYTIRQDFSRFGLQHLLAISGFHFALIAAFLHFILRIVFPMKYALIILLTLLSGYCFFLGPQASILRAWMMSALAIIGSLLQKKTTPLNLLGVALMIVCVYNPYLSITLSFQLSFAIALAILLLYPLSNRLLEKIFNKRTLCDMLKMTKLDQHGYCILGYLKNGMALTIAVNSIAFPLTLYYFHQFPFLSILYNLFFPFFVSWSLCLLIVGSLFSFLPFVSSFIHGINSFYTHFLLQMVSQIPEEMDVFINIDNIYPGWIILYLSILVIGGVFLREKMHVQHDEESFSYI